MSQALTFEDELLTTTAVYRLKEVRNMRERPRPIVDDMLSTGLETQSGGERVIVGWETEDHSQPTRIDHGYEGVSTFAAPTMVPGTANWAYVVQPAYISRRDQHITRGSSALLDRWKKRVANTEFVMRRDLEEVVLKSAAASGTYGGHAAYADFLSLNGDDQSTGFIEAATTGTNAIHGLSRASYPPASHPQFHNKAGNGAGSFSANGLNALYGMLVRMEDDGGQFDSSALKGYISLATGENLKRALRSREQYISETELDDGKRKAMTYAGIELQICSRLPNTGSATTSVPWSALFVNWGEGVKFIGQQGVVMSMDNVITIPGTLVQMALFHLMGQLVAPKNGCNALLYNAEAW